MLTSAIGSVINVIVIFDPIILLSYYDGVKDQPTVQHSPCQMVTLLTYIRIRIALGGKIGMVLSFLV